MVGVTRSFAQELHTMNQLTLALLALGLSAPTALAAPQGPGLVPVDLAPSDFVAVHEEDGQLYGFGNQYRALFHVNHVTFQPALGKTEPVTRDLHFTLQSAGRGTGEPVGVALGRRVEGTSILYDRGGLREVYDVKGIGLKQSFVFDTIPAGSGDLVVTCALHSNMELLEASPERVRFGAQNGQVEIGKVVCFDAAGMRVTGSMEFANGLLTMRLAEQFVDRAVAPLTIDPLVGVNVNVGTGSDSGPDCCFDGGSERWLYVWSNALSASDSDILGKMFDRAGSAISGTDVVVRTGTNWISTEPRVCHVREHGLFAVAWLDDWYTGGTTNDIRARTVKASNLNLGSVVTVRDWASGVSLSDIAVGGNRTSDRDEIAIGWNNASTIEARIYRTAADGTMTANTSVNDIGYGQGEANLAISDMDPDFDSFWFVCEAFTFTNGQSPNSDRSLVCSIRNTVLSESAFFFVHTTPGGGTSQEFKEQNNRPSISYANDMWVIAWQKVENVATSVEIDSIRFSSYYLSNELNLLYQVEDDQLVASASGESEWAPQVAISNGSAFLAYMSDSGVSGDADVYVKSFTPGDGVTLFGAHTCEAGGQYTTAGDMGSVRVASPTEVGAGEPDNERVMIATHRDNATDHVRRRMFEMRDGNVQNIGGGCGKANSVRPYFNCASIDGSVPRMDVYNAPAGQIMWLVIGLDRLDLTCGSGCTVVVNPFTSYVEMFTANANGQVTNLVNLPNNPSLQGMTYYQQWLMDTPGNFGCGVFANLEMSDCLRVTIQ